MVFFRRSHSITVLKWRCESRSYSHLHLVSLPVSSVPSLTWHILNRKFQAWVQRYLRIGTFPGQRNINRAVTKEVTWYFDLRRVGNVCKNRKVSHLTGKLLFVLDLFFFLPGTAISLLKSRTFHEDVCLHIELILWDQAWQNEWFTLTDWLNTTNASRCWRCVYSWTIYGGVSHPGSTAPQGVHEASSAIHNRSLDFIEPVLWSWNSRMGGHGCWRSQQGGHGPRKAEKRPSG